jgi:hypothetical protein
VRRKGGFKGKERVSSMSVQVPRVLVGCHRAGHAPGTGTHQLCDTCCGLGVGGWLKFVKGKGGLFDTIMVAVCGFVGG